ncbi:putative phosphatidylglycerophosphate synthase [Marinomonas sp. MED121]|uniref:CDP-alcohol phosphatidyltransferase family protein n=1 Tax=Marinomonas sp. MED121 TaxID=314277 RepID=UPI000068FD60|nr:CDP-alcohol phosphatidyltransferase family protein [Marinomonas sp. MED121]EAQ65460.1 putative phosphatidylglycerophosphate synthase [Marinomonas sp. MED121]
MLDRHFIKLLKWPLDTTANYLVTKQISANKVTVFGFLLGIMVIPSLAFQAYGLALFLIIINRLCDGLDGAIARQTQPTDLGGYLDITLDFIFYSAVIFGFALASPDTNALPAAFLIFSFMGTGSSFLAFAIMAEKRQIKQLDYGKKSLFYLGGLTEGAETIGLFIFICLMPAYFVYAAWIFASLCWLTTGTRIYASYLALKTDTKPSH